MSQHRVETVHEASDSHEGPIKTPKQLIWTVIFSFVIPIAVIVLLVNFVNLEPKRSPGSQGLEGPAVAERIKPIGMTEVKDLSDPSSMKTGEQVYQAQCAACHASGAAGAPKFADAAAWGPRVGAGFDALLHSALKGKGNMGPQGGGDFSDFEIARAVVYMADHGGAKFPEPAFTPPGGASAPEGAAAAAPAAAGSAAASAPN